jgi:hypothetical protein
LLHGLSESSFERPSLTRKDAAIGWRTGGLLRLRAYHVSQGKKRCANYREAPGRLHGTLMPGATFTA